MNLFIFGASGRFAQVVYRRGTELNKSLNILGYSRKKPLFNADQIFSVEEGISLINKTQGACLFCLHGKSDYIYELSMLRRIAPKIHSSRPFIYVSTAAIYSREQRLINSSSPERILSSYSLIKKTAELDLLSLSNLRNLHIIRPVDIVYSSKDQGRRPAHCVAAEKVADLIHSVCLNYWNFDRKISSIYLSADKIKAENTKLTPLMYLSNIEAARFAVNRYVFQKQGCLSPFLEYIDSSHEVFN